MSTECVVVFALYPGITQLDFTGPHEVLARLPGARCLQASVEGGQIQASGGIAFANLARLRDIPQCAILCVPGGWGTVDALGNQDYLGELRRLAAEARYVTSVCTGSLLLAAAGLLAGRRAACHWAWRDSLAAFGVVPDAARVVRDGNVLSGGGVTAGIDLALNLMAEIAGVDYAQQVQLAIEYAPDPPFDCGRPEHAPAGIVAAVRQRIDATRSDRDAAVRRAVAALHERAIRGACHA